MELTHRFSVPANLDTTWAAFSRLDQLAPCFPGATITGVDGAHYRGFVKIKFGPLPLLYNGSAQITDLNRHARRMVIKAVGEDRRGHGTATADVTATFTETGETTDVQVHTNLSITGRPAQFGGAVIDDASDRLLDLFANCLAARFRDGEFTGDRRVAAEHDVPIGSPAVSSPDRDHARPPLQLRGSFLPAQVKQYWPLLLGVIVGIGVAARILRRRR